MREELGKLRKQLPAISKIKSEPDAKEKIGRAKEYCQRNDISEDSPDLLYLILGEVRSTRSGLRSINFKLGVLLGTNIALIALTALILLLQCRKD